MGGRSCSVCEEWYDALTFMNYMLDNFGERPVGYSLDRVDNDGSYEPGNVRWASQSEQALNRRSRSK